MNDATYQRVVRDVLGGGSGRKDLDAVLDTLLLATESLKETVAYLKSANAAQVVVIQRQADLISKMDATAASQHRALEACRKVFRDQEERKKA